jgi:hypothetical protein
MIQPDLEEDMFLAEWFRTKVRENKSFAQNLYAALCNNEFQKLEVVPILKEETWSCSWRAAGGIVSRLRKEGDYMDWYCSGMGGFATMDDDPDEYLTKNGYVPESKVTDEIEKDLRILGWQVVKSD